jgi:hypothetical protein
MMGAKYGDITGGEQVVSLWADTIMGDRKPGPYGWGLFASWGYHQYGVFTYSPEMSGIDADYNGDGYLSEIETLQWSDNVKGGQYYKDWTLYDHPQLGPVEIGGWVKKVVPIDAGLEEICEEHAEFMMYQASLSPLIRLRDVKQTAVANGVFKVEATISNYGFLPTYVSETARANRRDMPVFVNLSVEHGEVVSGQQRINLGHLEGNAPGAEGYFLFSVNARQLPSKTVEWIVRTDDSGQPCSVRIEAAAAKAGRDVATVQF